MNKKGMSIIELILSLALFSVFIASFLSLFQSIAQNSDFQLSRFGTLLMSDANASRQSMQVSSWQGFNIFQHQFTQSTPFESHLSHPSHSAITLDSLAVDLQGAEGGSNCSVADMATSSWKSFSVSGSIDLGQGNSATALVARGNYVYMTANSATRTAADFFIVDVSDKNNPRIVSQLDTGPGLISIKLAGNYAFVGNSSINAQLESINISQPLAPKLVSSYKIPGNYSDATTIPNSLYFYKSRLYIGTKKSQTAEFHVIDVANVSSPKELGTYELNTQINDIFVADTASGTLAFLATPDDNELSVVDVSNPASLKKVATFNAAGSYGSGKSISALGQILFLARTKDALANGEEIYVLDASDPLHIKSLGTLPIGASVNSLVYSGNILFVATVKSGDNFQMFDASNPAQPVRLTSNIAIFPHVPIALSCSGNSFYVALQSNDALRIITAQ